MYLVVGNHVILLLHEIISLLVLLLDLLNHALPSTKQEPTSNTVYPLSNSSATEKFSRQGYPSRRNPQVGMWDSRYCTIAYWNC